MSLGDVSLRGLREELQLNLGITLVHHKAEIHHLAEHALRELKFEHQLAVTSLDVSDPFPSLGDYLSDSKQALGRSG